MIRVHVSRTPVAEWEQRVVERLTERRQRVLDPWRDLLKRDEFASVEDLVGKVTAFIADYTRTATPFRWTYDGRPLKAS